MEDPKTLELLASAKGGDREALGKLLDLHRERLARVVELRIDQRLRNRLDVSDVIQEAYVDACKRIAAYLENPTMPFFLWLRFLTVQKLLGLRRRHLGADRDACREISIYRGAFPEATSQALAHQLLGRLTSPTEAAARAEMKLRLQEALDAMEPMDREILALRHFEHLSNAESAVVLGIEESAASKRYLRALKRLRTILTEAPI